VLDPIISRGRKTQLHKYNWFILCCEEHWTKMCFYLVLCFCFCVSGSTTCRWYPKHKLTEVGGKRRKVNICLRQFYNGRCIKSYDNAIWRVMHKYTTKRYTVPYINQDRCASKQGTPGSDGWRCHVFGRRKGKKLSKIKFFQGF